MTKHIYRTLNLTEENIILTRTVGRILMTAVNINPDELVQTKISTSPGVANPQHDSHTQAGADSLQTKTSTETVHSTETIKGLHACDKLCSGENFQFKVKGLCSPVCDQIFSDASNPHPNEISVSTAAAYIVERVKDMYSGCDRVCACVCAPVCEQVCDNVCDKIF